MRYILIVLAVALLSGCVKVREKPEGISGYDKALINENVDRMIEIACLSNRVTLLEGRLSALESEARKAREVQPYQREWRGVITGEVFNSRSCGTNFNPNDWTVAEPVFSNGVYVGHNLRRKPNAEVKP